MPVQLDQTALCHAKALASAIGKKRTRDEGLRAIHAVLHVETATEALEHYGVLQQRFSEWKQRLPSLKEAAARIRLSPASLPLLPPPPTASDTAVQLATATNETSSLRAMAGRTRNWHL